MFKKENIQMEHAEKLTADELDTLRDPSKLGPGYDDLTRREILVTGGYLARDDADENVYRTTEKGRMAIKAHDAS